MKAKKNKPIATYDMSEGVFRVMEVVSGRYEQFSKTKFIEPHRRNFFSFFLIKTGDIKHSIDFQNYQCTAGDMFFMAPNEVYLAETADEFGGVSINCNPELLESIETSLPIIKNVFRINKISLNEEQRQYIEDLMQKMLREFNGKQIFSGKILRSHFSAFLFYLSRVYQQAHQANDTTSEEGDVIEKFRSLINLHWKKFKHIDDYAKLLYISPGHLNHIVKQQTGKQAIGLIQEKKILEAKRLLLHSKNSIKEIAYQIGFEDPAYFNRFFKRWNGVTPLAFRDKIREKYNAIG